MSFDVIELRDRSVAVRQRGAGPAIFMVHGGSCSSRAFEKQLESTLARRFRLIAIDLPGHGDSPPAANIDELSTLPAYATTIALAAEHLDASDAVFVGWSLGGHAILHATAQLPRAAGFLIFGAPPVASMADYGRAATDDPAIAPAFRADATDDEVRACLALFVRPGTTPPAFFFEDFRRTDPRARAALAASLGRGEVLDEVRVVAELTRPLAIVRGGHDRIARNRRWYDALSIPTLWRGAVQDVPDAGHAAQWETPDLFNRLLEEFALDCAKPA